MDLDKSLVFPIVVTLQRHDMVLVAEKEKIVVIIELTCPVEENFEKRHREKVGAISRVGSSMQGKGMDYSFICSGGRSTGLHSQVLVELLEEARNCRKGH